MPVDYSKWDALELSDDSDIEVHPNLDKRSFIRAKQNQIHIQRQERKNRITTLKFERIVNDGLLARIDALLNQLEEHKKNVEGKHTADEVDEALYDALTDVNADEGLGSDVPPTPPAGVHAKEKKISYSKMLAALVDQVKEEVNKAKANGGMGRYAAYITEVSRHQTKVRGLQKDLNIELTRLEREEGSKITSESIHTGFDSSHVSKATPQIPVNSTVQQASTKASQPELLNPSRPAISRGPTSGSEADIEEGTAIANPDDDDEADIEASPAAKQFGSIPFGDYGASLQFISANPQILNEKETDGLLAEAFSAQLDAKSKKDEDYARQCVHQALLLQYCRTLGRDGVGLFFNRVRTPGHQSNVVFMDDVNTTYNRIRTRTAELRKQRDAEADGDREQIQLHPVTPGSTINIMTPPPLEKCASDFERESRQIFESFPPGLRRALESGSLDKVNEVLGKMSVDEAEQVVAQLSDGGMLSLDEGVIDATTEEGKKRVEEIERMGRDNAAGVEQTTTNGVLTEDPGMD